MILSTTESLPGKTVDEVLGVVSGNIVKAKSVSGPVLDGLKKVLSQSINLGPSIITGDEVGIPREAEEEVKGDADIGDLSVYTELLRDLRSEALDRMKKNARKLKADAVVGIRFSTNVIMLHAFEVRVYGTAVKLT